MVRPVTAAASLAPAARPLPRLREDLRLLPLADGDDAGATGERLIYDPLRHRYLRLDAESVDLLSLWPDHTTADTLSVAAATRFARPVGTSPGSASCESVSRISTTRCAQSIS